MVGKTLPKTLPFFTLPALVQSVQSMSLSITPAQTAAWRKQIFEQLSERTKREMDNFRHYEQAIEQVRRLQAVRFFRSIRIFMGVCLIISPP